MSFNQKCMVMTITIVVADLLFAVGLFDVPKAGNNVSTSRTSDRIIATDYDNLHEAVQAAREKGIYHVYMPSGVYILEKTLNLTSFNKKDYTSKMNKQKGEKRIWYHTPIILEGAGFSTMLVARTGEYPAIDLSGTMFCVLKNFFLRGEGADCGILASRIKKRNRKSIWGAPSSGIHKFYNIRVHGYFNKACVICNTSEVNSFICCTFRNHIGDGIVFTHYNTMGIRSPYREIGQNTCTGINFISCNFMAWGKDSVALRIENAMEVTVDASQFATGPDAFSAIYIDGTVSAKNISIRDSRMEIRGGYNVYGVGDISDLIIEGGEWVAHSGNIYYENTISDKNNRAHQYAYNKRSLGHARNWNIRGIKFSRSFEEDPNLRLKEGELTCSAMFFESLIDSKIENITFYANHVIKDKDGKKKRIVLSDVPYVVVKKYSRRNVIQVPSREAAVLGGDARNNQIIAVAEGTDEVVPSLWRSSVSSVFRKTFKSSLLYDGIYRTYVNPDKGLSLFNLGMVNVFDVTKARKGDILVHDGTGFKDNKPRLSVYDGKEWVFFKIEDERPEK